MGKLFSYLWCHIDTISQWTTKINRALYMYMYVTYCKVTYKEMFTQHFNGHCEQQWIRCQFEKIVYPIWYSTKCFLSFEKTDIIIFNVTYFQEGREWFTSGEMCCMTNECACRYKTWTIKFLSGELLIVWSMTLNTCQCCHWRTEARDFPWL